MYIDYKELKPCINCGQRPEKLFQKNSSAIISVECRSCWRGASGSTWNEVRDNWNAANKRDQLMEVCRDSAFHIHTFRCKHAGDEDDELYIRKAIELGAKSIVFTDHAPFPGNPFGNRMDIEELPEYINTLDILKGKYNKRIQVCIGLEIEYLPSFKEYYKELSDNEKIDWLILGQHMYEYEPGVYSFSDTKEVKDQVEYIGLCEAMIEGMETRLFRVVAHPDRAFRRRKVWDDSMNELSRRLIETAIETGTVLEKNVSSLGRKHQYWEEFWNLLEGILQEDESKQAFWVNGLDAHSVAELDESYNKKFMTI